jgi:hypothetical protein
MRHRLRTRYSRASRSGGGGERAFSVEIRWAGHPTVYKIVHAKTESGASKAALHASMRAAAETGRGRADVVIVHADAGTKAEHVHRMRGGRG